MKVGHDEEADDAGDDTGKFDPVEAADSAEETIADLSVKNDNGSTGGEDEDAQK